MRLNLFGGDTFDNLVQLNEIANNLDRPAFRKISVHEKDTNGFRAVVSTKTDKVFAVVSDRYQIVQSSDILQDVCSALGKMGLHDVSGRVIEQKGRTFITILLPKFISETGEKTVGKDIQLGFSLINSYNTTKSLSMCGIAMRLVCSNGMIAPTILGTAFVKKHVGASLASDVEKATTNIIEQVIERSTYLQNLIKEATSQILQDDKEIEELLADNGFSKKAIEKIITRLEYSKNGTATKWQVYNAVTNYYTFKARSENARVTGLQKAEKLLLPAIRK